MHELTLASMKRDDDVKQTVLHYHVRHSTPGRDGTCLELDVHIKTSDFESSKKVLLNCPLGEIAAETQEAALDKLADWAERLAFTLRNRGTPACHVASYPAPTKPTTKGKPE